MAEVVRLLASTNNDVNLSTDDGETWQPLQLGKCLPWSYFRGMGQLPDRPEVVLLGNGDGPPGGVGLVARSSNDAASWQAAAMPGPANSTIWNFAVHAADPELAYASSVSGEIYRSTDRGESWVKLKREFGEIRALAWSPIRSVVRSKGLRTTDYGLRTTDLHRHKSFIRALSRFWHGWHAGGRLELRIARLIARLCWWHTGRRVGGLHSSSTRCRHS